jgi:hypothetical protein
MGRKASSSYEVTPRSTAGCRPDHRQITPTTRGQSHSGSGAPGGTDTLTVSINRGAEDVITRLPAYPLLRSSRPSHAGRAGDEAQRGTMSDGDGWLETVSFRLPRLL